MADRAQGYPLLAGKSYTAESVFRPENLLREARRQRQLPDLPVPKVCLLDPDGDIADHLSRTGTGQLHPGWACYHTRMWTTEIDGLTVGVVGSAVGAPFAVLVAEQLAASGADLVISITSAGQLTPIAEPPHFVLIDRALRDEGTSAHYQPPATWSHLGQHLDIALTQALSTVPQTRAAQTVLRGPSWTTDAPYRETGDAIAAARAAGAVCVEMEAAALYAYAAARGRDVVCLAHVTNTMAVAGDDFEKGHANGATASLTMAAAIARTVIRPAGPS
jgi:uridine phosphorylase